MGQLTAARVRTARYSGRTKGARTPLGRRHVAEEIATRSGAWKEDKMADDGRASLALHAYPAIGATPVAT